MESSQEELTLPSAADSPSVYELIYCIDVTKQPSVEVFEENGEEKVAFYLPLNGNLTSIEEGQKLAQALALKINQKLEAMNGNDG